MNDDSNKEGGGIGGLIASLLTGVIVIVIIVVIFDLLERLKLLGWSLATFIGGFMLALLACIFMSLVNEISGSHIFKNPDVIEYVMAPSMGISALINAGICIYHYSFKSKDANAPSPLDGTIWAA